MLLPSSSIGTPPQGVAGVVEVVLMPGKKVEHLGIKIELVGTIGGCAPLIFFLGMRGVFV